MNAARAGRDLLNRRGSVAQADGNGIVGKRRRGRSFRTDPYLAFLAARRLFAACSARELGVIARSCTPVTRPAGAVLMREGEPSSEFLLIVGGSVAVARRGVPEVVLGPEGWIGDVDLLAASVSSATVTARTEVELIVMSRGEFLALFDWLPSFRRRLVRSVASLARGVRQTHIDGADLRMTREIARHSFARSS